MNKHKMVDESWDLAAKPHLALEIILKSGEGAAGRRMNGGFLLPGMFPQETLAGIQVGAGGGGGLRLENPALWSSLLRHNANCLLLSHLWLS